MGNSRIIKTIHNIKYFLFSILSLFLLWALFSYGGIISHLLLPLPHEVFLYIYEGLIIKGFFLEPLCETLGTVLLSFLCGSIIGIVLGIIAGYYEDLYKILEMPLDFFRSLPSLLLIPLSFLLFGIGFVSSFIVISFSVFTYVFINTAYGVKYNRISYQEVGKIYNIEKKKEFLLIILPSVLPNIFAGIKMGFSIAFIVAIGSEMLNGHQGLGGRIIDAYMVFNTKEVFSIIIIIGILGYLGSKILNITEQRIIHWRGY